MANDNIKSLYLSANDVLEEPDDIDSAPKIPSTIEVHHVKRKLNVGGMYKLQFFKVVFYRKYGDPEVRDHPLLSFLFKPDNTCADCKDSYLGKEDCHECKPCEKWFHQRCFMAYIFID